jgi:hypothetical protein
MSYDPFKPYQLVCGFPGVPAANAGGLFTFKEPLPNGVKFLKFPGNFTGSAGRHCLTLPTATATFTIYKIPARSTTPTAFGTVTISTAGVFTFATAGGLPETFAAGDSLTTVAPGTPDATLADVEWELVATGTR